jgi:diguanylate cyclase (GGDEF)-like protein
MVIADGSAEAPGTRDGASAPLPISDAYARIAEAQATRDVLTGLPNRAVMVDRIGQALAQDARTGGCSAVFSVDLDRFDPTDEGHDPIRRDALLRRIAAQLVGALRLQDTVGRVGESGFMVLAPGVESPIHAVDTSARLVTELARRPRRGEDGEGVAASIGVAVSLGGRGTAEQLLHEAAEAMRRARALGGARAEVFDDLLWLKVQQRWVARQVFQTALDDRRIVVHYQSIVGVADREVRGYEALARIADTDGSILLPATFVPAAEASGLVVSLGSQMLERACLDAQAWLAGDPRSGPSVSVNLSARQFRAGDLPVIVSDILERTGLDPSRLHLELTETAVAEAQAGILEQLMQISEFGVQIGLDDFGTGFVSLAHLRRLPVTYVKVDQSFVHSVGADEGLEKILAAVVCLASDLGLRTIAEGVETEEQLDRLRELGCDQAQGYLFARPVVVGELELG